jgi:hypothetical protein
MARDPSELYDLASDVPVLEDVVLVQALDGFVDAGGAKRLAREHLMTTHGSRVLATFDVDALLDYRARRPLMTFAEDHWADYDDPQLALHLAHDAGGHRVPRAGRSRSRTCTGSSSSLRSASSSTPSGSR